MIDDELGLIEALAEGVFERPLWHGFLDGLRAHTKSAYAHFAFSLSRQDAAVMLYTEGGTPAALEDLVLRRRRLGAMPLARPNAEVTFGLPELFHRADPEYEAACRRQLGELGMEYVHVQPIALPNGTSAWLTCAGKAEHQPFTERLLARLAPHVKQALKTYATLEEQKFTSAVTVEASRRSAYAWLALDRAGHILDATPDVELSPDASQPLWRDGDNRLRFSSTEIADEVARILARYAGEPGAKPQPLILNRDPWTDMLIAPVQHRPAGARQPPVAILYLRSDRWSQADRCEQLAELFGLSSKEAQLAWALAQGTTISEAATEIGITRETARTYSKRIYFKTGARGQAELVRTILTSVLAIA